MQSIGQVLTTYTQGKTLGSDILKTYICEGCKSKVEVKQMIHLGGPHKGQLFEIEIGCRCWEIQQAKEALDSFEKRKMQSMFDNNSLINSNLQNATFVQYHPTNQSTEEAKQISIRYVQRYDRQSPKNLLLVGDYGLGKSHLAVSITKELMIKGFTCIFISVPKLLTKIRATYNKKSEHSEDELLSYLEKVDCLVLDDIGSEQSKKQDDGESWAVSKIFEVIDSRCGKHTIYTTNLNAMQLREKVGKRNFSRMMQGTEVVKMQGEDYRLKDF